MRDQRWFHRHPKLTLAAVTVVGVVLPLAAAEIALGLLRPPPPKTGMVVVRNGEPRYISLREFPPLTELVFYPEERLLRSMGIDVDHYDLHPHRVRVDADGFIMPTEIHPEPDFKIVFLGGSTTECFSVDEDKRFPYLVGRLLEADTAKKINTYNGGKGGNLSLHSINTLINKVVPMRATCAVFMHNINDLNNMLYVGGYWGPVRDVIVVPQREPSRRPVGPVSWKSVIPNIVRAIGDMRGGPSAGVARDEWKAYRGRKVRFDMAALESDYRKSLRTFVGVCRTWGIIPVLMTQASRFTDSLDATYSHSYFNARITAQGLDYPTFKSLFDRFNDIIRETARENDVMLIDLAERVPKSSDYFFDVIHYNNRGSVLVAGIIARQLRDVVTERRRSTQAPGALDTAPGVGRAATR